MSKFYDCMVPANYKVLLVDDDPAMLRLCRRWLEKAGYPVCTAADGQEALEAIEADCPDFLHHRLGNAAGRRSGIVPANARDVAAALCLHDLPDRQDRPRPR